jgi:glyoxylase-like metal-dependent hydrolase (beta-lactamase superfamily II)/8-oxo-dGTP pyrophosphatase MutT (NUDIX family)
MREHQSAPTPRLSATLVLARDGAGGPEVLLLRRADRGDQNSHAWVFPGGLVDTADADARWACEGIDDAAASARLGLRDGGLDLMLAALRESFEEAGLLLAQRADGSAPCQDASWWPLRHALQRGETTLDRVCRERHWKLDLRAIGYLAHWVTPVGMPKRFDTRFFLARAPLGQVAAHDGVEMVDLRWVRPRDVLNAASGIRIVGPARAVLADLARFDAVEAMLAWALAPREVPCIQPRLARNAKGEVGPVLPRHPAYAEIGRIDPQGARTAYSEIVNGGTARLGPDLLRVTAPNGSMLTGPGTNSYLLRGGPGEPWALIDPGPDDASHLQALLAQGRIGWILCTHHHRDHAGMLDALRAASGAPLYAASPALHPDVLLRGAEHLALGATPELEAIATPGHASDHICFALRAERMLFTGDHVMQGSSVVIAPPDGAMGPYMASLRALLERADEFDWLAPGHGFLIDRPRRALKLLLRHRQHRETLVEQALQRHGPARAEELLPHVYADVPGEKLPLALRSLHAHLLWLQQQQRAELDVDRWSAPSHPPESRS